jgi:DNA-binding phage protein
MVLTVTPFDPARHIETAEDVMWYLEAALDGHGPDHFLRAVRHVVKSGVLDK